jgi:OmcA/MtrC family decaheme c-type cytochrome
MWILASADQDFGDWRSYVQTFLSKRLGIRLAALLLVAAGAMYLVSADGPEFTQEEKAYYADANMVAFVRPGLAFTITGVEVAADGTVKARYAVKDPRGLPLDREGIYTPGTVSSSWILGRIPKGKTQYETYTTRVQTSPITGVAATQAGADSGGTYEKVADGEYIYTFRTKLPANYDKTVTHTVGMYGSRNLTEFDLGVNLDDAVYNWVPDGSKVTVTRDVIKAATCDKCHVDLTAHGETGRTTQEICVMCHTPQTIDPDTGESQDMPVLTHRIHMGADLPSVQAGKPYVIIGNAQSRHDFSTVRMPSDVRRCTHCHEQNTGAAQATAYLKGTRAACGACHDDVNFETGANHGDLPQISDNQCVNCHTPDGEVEFDLSIKGAHTVPAESRYLPGTVVELKSITSTAPGQNPKITFALKTKAGNPIPVGEMNRLRFRIAGPNTDWASQIQEDSAAARIVANQDGSYTYTMAYAVPATATGSYTLAVEAYRNYTILVGTAKEQTIRDFATNPMLAFSVDGTTPVARRTVVSTAACNKCHASLSFHGGNRNVAEYCGTCHNPNAVTTATATAPSQAYDYRLMIHKIHTGEELSTPYCFGNTCFNEVRYPGDRRVCAQCHVNNSQQLPLAEGHLDVKDPQGLLNPVGPESAACLSCHTTQFAASHALANTTQLGESCATCHGPNADFSVNRAHAR